MLTKKKKEILDFIKSYIKKNDYSPSMEEIAHHFKRSVGTIHEHLETLKDEGFLEKLDNQPRSINVLDGRQDEKIIEIPVVGTIAAGQPIETIEIPGETITLTESEIGKTGKHYALRVQGNSMVNEGIFDGDTVIIRRQPTAENGETVVAVIDDNEATLKKLYREKGRFRLQPANPTLSPFYRKEIEIRGVVVKIIRNFEKIKQKPQETKEFTDLTNKYINETDIKHRKSLGQYFTPKSIREILVSKLPNTINSPKVLDPGCGTGEFLITAKKHFKSPELYGLDIDNKLTDIAKGLIPEAKFKCTDALLNEEYNTYDFVIGNPPYYEFTPSKETRGKFGDIMNGRVNIFSLFIYQGINWLKEGGYLAYVVPPSMNNGAYFLKLRKFIVDNTNIEYLHILDDPKIFKGALQSTMLLVLRKGKNKGDYLFKKNSILIFSENAEYLKKAFKNKLTLHDLGYEVKTGKVIWNENRNLLTNDAKGRVPLIWAQNITSNGLNLSVNDKKPQYIKKYNPDTGPAIVVNRITGTVKTAKLRAAIVPPGMKFFAENHVNVITPAKNKGQGQLDLLGKTTKKFFISLNEIAKQLSSPEKLKVIRNITGNTQISKTELEKLFPLDIKC